MLYGIKSNRVSVYLCLDNRSIGPQAVRSFLFTQSPAPTIHPSAHNATPVFAYNLYPFSHTAESQPLSRQAIIYYSRHGQSHKRNPAANSARITRSNNNNNKSTVKCDTVKLHHPTQQLGPDSRGVNCEWGCAKQQQVQLYSTKEGQRLCNNCRGQRKKGKESRIYPNR